MLFVPVGRHGHKVHIEITTVTYKQGSDQSAEIWMGFEPQTIIEINWEDEDQDLVDLVMGNSIMETQKRKHLMKNSVPDEEQAKMEEESDEIDPHAPTTVKDEPKLSGVVVSRKKEDTFCEIRDDINDVDNEFVIYVDPLQSDDAN